MATEKAATKKTSEPEPNIIFIGDRLNAGRKDVKTGQDGFIPYEPIKSFSVGMETVKLPSADEQLAGPFYHPRAGEIVRLYPKFYKQFVKKGK